MRTSWFLATGLGLLAWGVGVGYAQMDRETFSYPPGTLAGSGEWVGEELPGCPQVQPGQIKLEGFGNPSPGRVFFPRTASKVHEASRPFGSRNSPFFAFVLRVDASEGLPTDRLFGIFRMGHGSTGPFGAGLYLKKGAAGEIEVWGSKRANPEKVEKIGQLAAGRVQLIVGQYDATTHAFHVWMNPDAGSYGSDSAPEGGHSIMEGNPLSQPLDTVILGGGVGSPGLLIDELRVGDTWAEVTTPY